MPEDKKTYWAFISYSSKDNKIGSWLHNKLENYNIPKEFQKQTLFDGAVLGKNLRPVFRDRDELSGSSNLGEAIHQALESSRFLIVLCSKNSSRSEWVNKEIESFRAMGKGDHILALILNGEPNSTTKGRPEDECFPPALQYPAEPIAGDMRKDGDGKDRGFLKILAGITQLDFDKLYRRHEKAQARRRFFTAIIAALLITGFAILAGYAKIQESKAEKNAEIALKSEKEAEHNAEIARQNAEIAKQNEKRAEENARIAKGNEEKAKIARKLAEIAEASAKEKFRDLLFGKYESAKEFGAQEEAMTYLSEVLKLTREDGVDDSRIASLIDLEQILLMKKNWEWGQEFPRVDKIYKVDNTSYIFLSKDSTLWSISINKNNIPIITPLFPQFRLIEEIVKTDKEEFLFLNSGILYRYNVNTGLQKLLSVKNTTTIKSFAYIEKTSQIVLFENSSIKYYDLKDTNILLANEKKLLLRRDTIIYDFVFDEDGETLCIRANDLGIKRLLIVDLSTGEILSKYDRQGSWSPVRFLNGKFIFAGGGNGNFSEIILIDPKKPKQIKRVNLPYEDIEVCIRDKNSFFIISNQAIIRAIDINGKIIENVNLNLDSFWGDMDITIKNTGDLLIISSNNNIQFRNPNVISKLYWKKSINPITKTIPLKNKKILISWQNGWAVIDENREELSSGSNCHGVLSEIGASEFFWWSSSMGHIETLNGKRTSFPIPNGIPRYYLPTAKILVIEDSESLIFYNIVEGVLSESITTNFIPDHISLLNDQVYCIKKNKYGEIEFYPYENNLESLGEPISIKTSFKDSTSPIISSDNRALYWRDAEGLVNILDLLEIDSKSSTIIKYPLSDTTNELIPATLDHFGIRGNNGVMHLYKKGILVRSFLPSTYSDVTQLIKSEIDQWLIQTEDGNLLSINLPTQETPKSFGEDWLRLYGPEYEAVRSGTRIDVRWNDGEKTRLIAPGNGVESYRLLTQSIDQKRIAAVDNGQTEILLWNIERKEQIIANIYGYDSGYGGIWFKDNNTLIAGLYGKVLIFEIINNNLRLVENVKLPLLKHINIFHYYGENLFFGRHGERVFYQYNLRTEKLSVGYGLDEIQSLHATKTGLYVGYTGLVDLWNYQNKRYIKRFEVPSEEINNWYVRELLAIDDRDLLVFDQGPNLIFFNLRTAKWLGKFIMPENFNINSYNNHTSSLYISGTHFSKNIQFKSPPVSQNIKDFSKSLPYHIEGVKLIPRESEIVFRKEI